MSDLQYVNIHPTYRTKLSSYSSVLTQKQNMELNGNYLSQTYLYYKCKLSYYNFKSYFKSYYKYLVFKEINNMILFFYNFLRFCYSVCRIYNLLFVVWPLFREIRKIGNVQAF